MSTARKEQISLVFVGHVDAGKSTLCGNILINTGMIDSRTIETQKQKARENGMDSWWMSQAMDCDDAERTRGKTVDVGRASFSTPAREYTILDAPGHKSYVPNMISGATQADIAVLVVSARIGEYEAGVDGGQTREHALLVKTLGVRDVIVVVNKLDLPYEAVAWSETRQNEVVTGVTALLRSVGFSRRRMRFLPISAQSGEGLVSPAPAPWYDGLPLLRLLDTITIDGRDSTTPLRVTVADVSKYGGVQSVVGKIEAGTLSAGDEVIVMPMRTTAVIERITLNDEEVPVAAAGDPVNLQVKANANEIQRGFVLCARDAPIPATKRFQAQISVENLGDVGIMSGGQRCVLHAHSATEDAEVARIVSVRTPEGERPARFLREKSIATVVISVSRAICLEKYETMPRLGSFTLRNEGGTVAVGKVIGLPREHM